MEHRDYEELLILYFYEDLDEAEAEIVEEHLAGCPDCRSQLKRLHRMGQILLGAAPEPSEIALWQARGRLRESISKQASSEAGAWFGPLNLLSSFWRPQTALAHAAVLLLGLLSGYLIFAPGQVESQETASGALQGGEEIRNVRFEEVDLETNRVDLTFEVIRRFQLSGSPEDRRVQRLLAHALINEQNPGVRLRALTTMGQAGVSAEDEEVVAALIGALRTDENVAVRQKALRALRDYPPTPEIKQAWIDALISDANPRIRMEAIQALTGTASEGADLAPDLLNRLSESIQEEENAFVKDRTQRFLQQVGYGKF